MSLLKTIEERAARHEERFASGIEQHRKGDFTVCLQDAAGKPIAGKSVQITLTRHACRFGANTFMQGGYEKAEDQAAWDQAFARISNSAVVGCFWGAYEPVQGQYRFAVDSAPFYRRPPIDQVLAFCDQHALEPKFHNLNWGQILPAWIAPLDDTPLYLDQVRHWMEALAERYANRIRYVDVVNEIMANEGTSNRIRNYVPVIYQWARELFPTSKLYINETVGHSWKQREREYSVMPMLYENLRFQGAPIDGIGMQYHHFNHAETCVDHWFSDPDNVFDALDRMGSYGLPIDISEITIPGSCNAEDGEALQAAITTMLYRCWFSHGAVDAIYWWNLADGHAFAAEGAFLGGLLREDLSPKPAYEAVDHLINQEWHTDITATSDDKGQIRFRGFLGDYDVDGKSVTFSQAIPKRSITTQPTGAHA
jgi:GH35 family endo-1,4-beta-xylanase